MHLNTKYTIYTKKEFMEGLAGNDRVHIPCGSFNADSSPELSSRGSTTSSFPGRFFVYFVFNDYI